MKLELYKDAMLGRDFPEHGLRQGDIVKLVEHHRVPEGSEGYSVEVFNALGDTISVITVDASDLQALGEDQILCARAR
jgi:hypothetical protein